MAKRLKPHEMSDEQFERWLKRHDIRGMAAVNASMKRKLDIQYYAKENDERAD
jgi:hypothetical protein